MDRRILSSLILTTVGAFAPGQTGSFALKDHDRVVLYGDSITDNSPYGNFLDAFVALRYPNLDISFMNAGVGGDRVTGGWMGKIDDRLTRDLFSRKPTVITVMLGMNDASYRPLDQGIFDTYQSGYRHMVDRFKKEAPGARAWLIRPSAYDDITRAPGFEGGYNGVLVKYGDFVQSLATQNGYETIDLDAPIVAMLEKAKANDAANAPKLIGDRVHPGGATHLLMANEILKSWHASPLVADTIFSWDKGPRHQENSSVTNAKTGSFDLLERALPFPIDRGNAEVALVLKSSDIERDMNREKLTIVGVPAGDYDLKFDGKVVGTFTADEFALGIDLSHLPTPMMAQAVRVMDISNRLNALRYTRWRTYEHGLDGVGADQAKADAIRGLEKLEKALMAERHKAAQPVPHHVEIVSHQA